MNRQDFDNFTYQKTDPEPDRKKAEKLDTRKFWLLWIPLGALAGFFACVTGGSGAYFIPVGGIVAFLLWAMFGRSK